MDRLQEIERSIIKTYRKEIWRNFAFAVGRYQLIQQGDKIAACISGGKDSMLMAKCLQEIQRHGPVPFELVFLVMDPGYNEENRRQVEKNVEILGLPVHIVESDIFEVVSDMGDDIGCYMCARMRRGCLYRHAQELGCNKIALGHHFDDVIETILMSMLYGGQVRTMMPKLHSTNYPDMQLIRPMYLIKEADIKRWAKHHELEFIRCACRFTEHCSPDDAGTGKRQEMKQLVQQFRQISPRIEQNIFASVENINLETVISYKDRNGLHSFLDDYDELGPKQ